MSETPTNFIRNIINQDLKNNKNDGRVATRFPPEPNGYLHIGHAKSICLNFGVAEDYKGTCNLRFDDTNPVKEDVEYVDSIKEDVQWLGYQWHGDIHYASDYFDKFHDYAVELIKAGKAFVCSLSAHEMREYRGTLKEPGKDSPFKNRTVEENLDLFQRMRDGEFKEGDHVLRVKIDMASPNMNMRDPVIYRILNQSHHQTGDKWHIYPMYDYAHCISDALEGITHSLCTLEFEDHRPLYDWVLDNISIDCHPQQIEFARLSLEYTVMSKRKLNTLVAERHVSGWDDPRMPSIAGMRRRGFTPESIREFCNRIGLTKVDTTIEMGVLESCIREDLDPRAPRAMAVLDPLKIVITNYPENNVESLSARNHPKDESLGSRTVPFTREIYIDRDDFKEVPPRKYKRLTLGGEVRLRYGYVIKCEEAIKDSDGNITELRCTYDENTLGKNPEDRKIKGVIHWVSATESLKAQVRLYDRLFNVPNPDAGDFESALNPDSLKILNACYLEQSLAQADSEQRFQFEREGYFCKDAKDSTNDMPVFNRIVTLRDTWAKLEQEKS